MKCNLQIAKEYLKNGILYRYSEHVIKEYIRFMDTLKEEERKEILLNPEISKLVDKINKFTDGEIELNKIHKEV